MVRERNLRRAREPGTLPVGEPHVEGIVGAGCQGGGVDIDPRAVRELGAQRGGARLDAPDPAARVLDVHVRPLWPDADGPAPVRRAMQPAV